MLKFVLGTVFSTCFLYLFCPRPIDCQGNCWMREKVEIHLFCLPVFSTSTQSLVSVLMSLKGGEIELVLWTVFLMSK